MIYEPIRFISKKIEVHFIKPPTLKKKPGCPDGFTWNDDYFQIQEILNEWYDFRRRGRMTRNMQPEHATTAEKRGSWGVGQFYFRVRTLGGRIFDIYYDRSPKDVDHRHGEWFLFRELTEHD